MRIGEIECVGKRDSDARAHTVSARAATSRYGASARASAGARARTCTMSPVQD